MCIRDSSSAVFAESPDGADLLSGLYRSFSAVMDNVKQGCFSPVIIYETGKPVEFSAITLSSWPEENCRHFSSISEVLELYYAQKNQISRIRQKSSDLRRIVQTALERNVKKYDLQARQLKDTEKREKYRIYGAVSYTHLDVYKRQLLGKFITCSPLYSSIISPIRSYSLAPVTRTLTKSPLISDQSVSTNR